MTGNIIIRKMRDEDCERIAYIDAQCIPNPWTKKDFDDLFRCMENQYFVAEADGQVVGFVGLIQYIDDGDITHIAVLEKYRNKGIAKALLENLFSLAKEKKMNAIHLEVREHNATAQNLYRHMGFEEIGVRKNYYSQPIEDAIVMVKNL